MFTDVGPDDYKAACKIITPYLVQNDQQWKHVDDQYLGDLSYDRMFELVRIFADEVHKKRIKRPSKDAAQVDGDERRSNVKKRDAKAAEKEAMRAEANHAAHTLTNNKSLIASYDSVSQSSKKP